MKRFLILHTPDDIYIGIGNIGEADTLEEAEKIIAEQDYDHRHYEPNERGQYPVIIDFEKRRIIRDGKASEAAK